MRLISTIFDENNEEFEIADKDCRENKLDKEDLPKSLSYFKNDLGLIDKTVSDLENYYKKTETYTQEEIDGLLSRRLNFEVVDELPAESISPSTIYLVRKSSLGNGKPSDGHCEYIYANGKWELIGDTDIDLSDYYTKSEMDERMQELAASGDTANQATLQAVDSLKSALESEASERKSSDNDLKKRLDNVNVDISTVEKVVDENKGRLDNVENNISTMSVQIGANSERLNELLEVTEEYVDEETGETVIEPAGEGSLESMLKKAVGEAVAKVVADAPESFDTLKEISDWIAGHADDASAMNTQIGDNKAGIAELSSQIDALKTAHANTANTLNGMISALTDRVSALEGQLNGISFEVV